MSLDVKTKTKTEVTAVVTRADGRVENLGLISYDHVNPFKRWVVNLWIKIRRSFLGA
jgi:hypothetical protein